MSDPLYRSRSPRNEPELISLEYSAEGFTDPHGRDQPRRCGMGDCGRLAFYEGTYSDQSWTYFCRDHGVDAAEYAGLEEAE